MCIAFVMNKPYHIARLSNKFSRHGGNDVDGAEKVGTVPMHCERHVYLTNKILHNRR
jgi:hypothetical protein